MHILLTGTSGFVGQNLAPYLQKHGHQTILLSLRGEWVSHLPADVDVMIHLAGKAHDTAHVSKPEEYFRVNTDLTQELFDFFLKSTARDFIFFSTVKAAADTVEGVLTEEMVAQPKTPYGQSKLKAEQYLFSQEVPPGKRVIILRPCMIHGPGNKGNLNLLYKMVKKGLPWPLAAFANRRSFLSIDNLCYLIDAILVSRAVPSGIYNLADDGFLSTNELVSIIAESEGKKPRLMRIPGNIVKGLASVGDTFHLPLNSERLKKLTESYVVSNNKIKKALGIQKLPLSSAEGLAKTIRSFG